MTEVKLLEKNAKFWGAKQYVLHLWTFLPLVLDSSVVKSFPVIEAKILVIVMQKFIELLSNEVLLSMLKKQITINILMK